MKVKQIILTIAAASSFGLAADGFNVVNADGIPSVVAGQSGLPSMDVVDVASYQGNLSVDDFKAMKAAGIKGVIVKLTESTNYTNPFARTQVNNARAAGMKVSAYHFARYHNGDAARAEANYFADTANSLGFSSSDLMVNDVEDKTMINDNVSGNSKTFNDQLHARGFSDTGLYTYSTYNMDRSFMPNNRIWMASYPFEPSSSRLWNTQYGMWQWTSNAHVNGVSGTFDMSVDYTNMASIDSGYRYVPSAGGWRWVVNGQMYTGFQYYMGAYYWFNNGVRSDNSWHEAWGNWYYTDSDGRAVQGHQRIDGQDLYFGDNGTFALQSSGYINDRSSQNGGYRWYENGHLYTGFRFYMGTYYWFIDGVRQNEGWRYAWNMKYYTDNSGRAVQGVQKIDGTYYNFGNDGTYFERGGYIYDGSSQNGGYRWYNDGKLFTGFRYYMGTYYWFVDGVRQNAGWRQAWGMTYYTDQNGRAVQGIQTIDGKTYNFGTDGTYYLR